MADKATIFQSLAGINDPELGRSFGELGMVGSLDESSPGRFRVELILPTHGYPGRERLEALVRARVPQVESVRYSVKTLGKESGGTIGLSVKNVIAVGSGKGGVGKSTVAASIAYGLKTLGAEVGLMDADVYGPSIPHLFGAQGKPELKEVGTGADGKPIRRIEPIQIAGVKLMSMAFFVEPEQAVVWRGPMLHGAITQFLKDTNWGPLDYLIIDLPPGTGDVSLTLSQLLGLAGAVVVCTPQQLALLDAVKAVSMFRTVKIPVLGMVENMSGEIFGRGGAQKKSGELGVPFLGEVPIDAEIRIRGDAGEITRCFDEGSPSREPLLQVCMRTAIEVTKQILSTPRMPTLEIL